MSINNKTAAATIIIGIDPGSRITGFGIIEVIRLKSRFLHCGSIQIKADNLTDKLKQIFANLDDVIQTYKPHEAAIEQVFMHQNPGSALKLGQARGAAVVAIANHDLPLAEYSARQVKQSMVGYGAATKEQVQHMVCQLLQLKETPQADAADALAIALCHAHSRLLGSKIGIRSRRRGRLR